MERSSFARTLVWTLIAAAFIGPGTVTTAFNVGSYQGSGYFIWALLAAGAGYFLMEMSARITLVSQQSLGQLIGRRYRWLAMLCLFAVCLGCLAYQAGNLLGALSGLELFLPGLPRYWVIALGALAAVVLNLGDTRKIGRVLGVVVAVMGVVFVVAAVLALTSGNLDATAERRGSTGAILALVGTTIVPYNFFLAAGLTQGQQLGEMRKGLLGAFGLGALITMAIIVVGSTTDSFAGFDQMAGALEAGLGSWSKVVIGAGLLAAGLSSAITAPLAAAIAGRELIGNREAADWSPKGKFFRGLWVTVLSVGVLVACLDLNIIGVIVSAQVANGLLLPLVVLIVLFFANDRQLLGPEVNPWWQTALGILIALYLTFSAATVISSKVQQWRGVPFEETNFELLYAVVMIIMSVAASIIWRRRNTKTALANTPEREP